MRRIKDAVIALALTSILTGCSGGVVEQVQNPTLMPTPPSREEPNWCHVVTGADENCQGGSTVMIVETGVPQDWANGVSFERGVGGCCIPKVR